jgi:hypothetical protein
VGVAGFVDPVQLPAVVGVPLKVCVEALNAIPGGRLLTL